jgi:hypothetical protein
VESCSVGDCAHFVGSGKHVVFSLKIFGWLVELVPEENFIVWMRSMVGSRTLKTSVRNWRIFDELFDPTLKRWINSVVRRTFDIALEVCFIIS